MRTLLGIVSEIILGLNTEKNKYFRNASTKIYAFSK